MLVDMDLISKRIGLFPQSNKIDIHKVTNIEEEIKSISNPPEPYDVKVVPNQDKVLKRINSLSKRFVISNETRFKYILASALPNASLSNRLLKILERYPHLYKTIFFYFRRYATISKAVSKNLLSHIKTRQLYSSYTADGLRVLRDHSHPSHHSALEKIAREIYDEDDGLGDSDLRAAAVSVLLSLSKFSWKEITDYIHDESDWWPISEIIQYLDIEQVGKPSYENLINKLLCSESIDVAVVAVDHLSKHALDIQVKIGDINPIAQLSLKKLGVISARRGGPCPISLNMKYMLGPTLAPIKWKQVLNNHYQGNIPVLVRLKGYYESDATAWVNLLDALHDDILDSLYSHDSQTLGQYTHGNMGSVMNASTGRLASNYPSTYEAFSNVHETRLESMLSHSITRSTGKRTRYIEYKYIKQITPKLIKAYLEIWRNW